MEYQSLTISSNVNADVMSPPSAAANVLSFLLEKALRCLIHLYLTTAAPRWYPAQCLKPLVEQINACVNESTLD